jgi:hypothetical protein
VRNQGGLQSFFGFGAYAKIGVRFGEENLAVFCDDVSGGNWKTPTVVPIHKRDVDEN